MKKIEITTYVDEPNQLMPFKIEDNQKVIFTQEGFFKDKLVGLQLKSETLFDTHDAMIILKKQDLINILKFLLEPETDCR